MEKGKSNLPKFCVTVHGPRDGNESLKYKGKWKWENTISHDCFGPLNMISFVLCVFNGEEEARMNVKLVWKEKLLTKI